MNRQLIVVLSLTFVLSFVGLNRCRSGEQAKLPYQYLCQISGARFNSPDLPREMSFTAASTRPGVKPSDIRLTLLSGDQSHEIAVAADGGFVLPVRQLWFDNNATLVANQPKGTMTVKVAIELKNVQTSVTSHLTNGRIAYARLVTLALSGIKAAESKAAQQMGVESTQVATDYKCGESVMLVWANESYDSANAIIERGEHDSNLELVREEPCEANSEKEQVRKLGQGYFVVPYSEALCRENPTLSLTENPTWQCLMIAAERIPDFEKYAQARSSELSRAPDGPPGSK